MRTPIGFIFTTAALVHKGQGALICARSGTGKTTLAAALASRRWVYGTDESIAIEVDGSRVTSFPKPLMIKPGGGALVPSLQAAESRSNPEDDLCWAAPASSLGALTTDSIQPRCIVLLSRLEGSRGPAQHQFIHPADAVVALMAQTLDPRRFGSTAVDVLARLAAQSTCVTLSVESRSLPQRVWSG